MAFPETSIITSFTGSDENPISEGGIWTGPFFAGHGQLVRASNQCRGDGSADASSYLVATYGPNVEFYFTIATASVNDELTMFFKIVDPGAASMDGYLLDLDSSIVKIFRVDDNSNTQLGADISQAFASGDAIGVSYSGGMISAYRKPSGGSWGSIGSRSDSTYANQSGVLGIYTAQNNIIIDDLGGGTINLAPGPGGYGFGGTSIGYGMW